jgi:hypothetical protein
MVGLKTQIYTCLGPGKQPSGKTLFMLLLDVFLISDDDLKRDSGGRYGGVIAKDCKVEDYCMKAKASNTNRQPPSLPYMHNQG